MGNEVLRFTKLHGLGNDFVLIAGSESSPPADLPQLSRFLLDRRRGCGGDQLLWLGRAVAGQNRLLRIYNPDGSEAEMCGNGVRAAALWLQQEENLNRVVFATLAGPISTHAVPGPTQESWFRVGMGVPRISAPLEVEVLGTRVTGIPVDMGNPHFVVRNLPKELRRVPLETWGRALETHAAFPDRTNVEWVRPVSAAELAVDVWERGAGLTLACGTGACASAVAAMTERWMTDAEIGAEIGATTRTAPGAAGPLVSSAPGRTVERASTTTSEGVTPVTVTLPGGSLKIEWAGPGSECFQTGPAVRVFDAVLRRE